MSDPFRTLGFEPALDLDPGALEARYVELSRACHPDHHATDRHATDRGDDAAAQTELLARAAAVNDAYRVLRDRWRRAEACLEALAPGVVERNKELDPEFLMEAMELAEEVAGADAAAAPALRERLEQAVEQDYSQLAAAVARGEFDAAAVHLHQSRYHRKALRDLRDSGTSR